MTICLYDFYLVKRHKLEGLVIVSSRWFTPSLEAHRHAHRCFLAQQQLKYCRCLSGTEGTIPAPWGSLCCAVNAAADSCSVCTGIMEWTRSFWNEEQLLLKDLEHNFKARGRSAFLTAPVSEKFESYFRSYPEGVNKASVTFNNKPRVSLVNTYRVNVTWQLKRS